jgi:hypothetical protein
MNPGSGEQGTVLAREARYLHSCFFRDDAPDDVVDRYVAFNMLHSAAPSRLTDTIVARRLDAEAIELVFRSRNKGSGILTRKIRILFYLLEVRAEYYPVFFSKTGRDETWLLVVPELLSALPRTVVKYLKGTYLVRKYRLSEHGVV